jgi:hypothetical protein
MPFTGTRLLIAGALSLVPSAAAAQAPPSLPSDEEEEAIVEEEEVEEVATDEDRIRALEDKVADLEQRLSEEEKEPDSPITFAGYIDFGFFAPIGDGPGWIQDFGNQHIPELAGRYAWVFLGDILATTVNSRGEVADLGDAPGATRFDSVNSNGAPGFLLNEVNFRLNVGLHESLKITTSVNFVPRTGSEFALGDFFDLDLAEAEWRIFDDPHVSVMAGKIDPVIGIEYKDRKADARFGITPSLIQRYTSGTQLGIKARARFFSDWIILAFAFTNGSSTTEQFHFYNEVDANRGKTFSGRLSFRIPVGDLISALDGHTLEIGGSGEFGPQDRDRQGDGNIWFAGADLEYRGIDFAVKAQWLKGKAPGSTLSPSWELDLRSGAYVEIDWLILPWLGLIVRGDVRDALVALTTERAYVTKSWRITAGLVLPITHHVILKAEYLKNGEYGDVPEFQNDVFTSSLVLRY